MIKYFIFLVLLSGIALSKQLFAASIIAHPATQANILTTAQLRRIYTMRQTTWPDGQAIVVYTLPSSHPLHQEFSKNELKIFPYQLDKIWIKLTFSGLAKPPIKVETIEQLIEAVQSTPGAIGYVNNKAKFTRLKTIAMEANKS